MALLFVLSAFSCEKYKFSRCFVEKFRLDAAQETSSWTVAELSSDALIVVVLKFLGRLQAADDGAIFTLPSGDARAPVGVAERHRVGSQLANILKVCVIYSILPLIVDICYCYI